MENIRPTILVFVLISLVGLWDIDTGAQPWMLIVPRRHTKLLFNVHCHQLEFHQLNPWQMRFVC